MNIKCAIFDFDGTLFDSMPVWKGLKFKFFESLGVTLTEQDKLDFSGLFLMDALPLAIKRFNLKQDLRELYSLFWEMLTQKYLESARPKCDVLVFLEKLYASGVKMGIATATGEDALIPLLKKYNILHYFSSIYSTYTVNAPKCNPKVYDVVREELGFNKKDTLVFEDALYAAQTAKQNGYNVVGIFDKSEPKQETLKTVVDIYIKKYSEISL